MMPPILRWLLRGLPALVLIGLGPLGGVSVLGQDDQAAPSYPVAIFQGSCETPAAEPSFLVGTTYSYGADPDDDTGADLDLRGTGNIEPVATVAENLDTTFQTLLDDQPHLIAVHQDDVSPDRIIACGELGGIIDDGRLVVGLRPADGADVAGIAIFDEDTAGFLGLGGDEVNIRVYLMDNIAVGEPSAPEAPSTPAAGENGAPAGPTAAEDEMEAPTPTAPPEGTPSAGGDQAADGEQAQAEVTVESVDIDFNPNEFTIPADTDVTVHLPNNGAAPHTFTVDELGIDVELAPGEEQTITINAPAGTYEYYCAVPGHAEAGMVGTMTVE